MNFKRKKHHKTHKLKKRELNARKPIGWSYGGAIAREIVNRSDFNAFIRGYKL